MLPENGCHSQMASWKTNGNQGLTTRVNEKIQINGSHSMRSSIYLCFLLGIFDIFLYITSGSMLWRWDKNRLIRKWPEIDRSLARALERGSFKRTENALTKTGIRHPTVTLTTTVSLHCQRKYAVFKEKKGNFIFYIMRNISWKFVCALQDTAVGKWPRICVTQPL